MRGPILLLALSACTGLKPIDNVTGDDTGSVTFGTVVASPSSLDFGDIAVGSEGTADLTLHNDGTSSATLTDAFVTGDTVFSLHTSVSLPTDVAAGDDTVLTFAFDPNDATAFQGTFRLGVSGQDGYGEVPLTGTGTTGGDDTGGDSGSDTGGDSSVDGAGMSVSESAINFGRTDIISPASETVTLKNIGTEDILLTDFSSDDPSFTVAGNGYTLPAVLGVGNSRTMAVTFTPEEEISYSGTVTITTDPDTVEAHIAVSGVGYRSCTICAPILDVDTGGTDPNAMTWFDAFTSGPAFPLPLVLTNDGDEDLTISNMAVTNDIIATCGAFSTDWGGTATTIAAGASLRANVIYTATGSCYDTAFTPTDTNILHILSDDPSVPDWTVSLTATIF